MLVTVFHCFSPFYAQERIAISLFGSHKTSNSLEKPKSEFPTLGLGDHDHGAQFTVGWSYIAHVSIFENGPMLSMDLKIEYFFLKICRDLLPITSESNCRKEKFKILKRLNFFGPQNGQIVFLPGQSKNI